MKLSELTPGQTKRLMSQCLTDYNDYLKRTNDGKVFGSNELLPPEAIFKMGFSRGVQATLKIIEIVKS